MRALSESEITRIIQEGKKLSEEEGTAVLDQFEQEQPEIYQAIFGPLSDAIGENSLDMSYLFLDLCFDIIWAYRKEFGNPSQIVAGQEWLNAKISRLDAEMKALDEDLTMSERFRHHLQGRFVDRSAQAQIQLELLKYLEDRVHNYASFERSRQIAIRITSNLIFVVAMLMAELYSEGA
jgi:hypothetical protein